MKKQTRILLYALAALLPTLVSVGFSVPVAASAYQGINGRIVYTDTNNYAQYRLTTIKSDGTGATTVAVGSTSRRYPRFSADGTKIAFSGTIGSYSHIFTANADGSNVTQLTSGSNNNIQPSFSPDGTKIVYSHVSSSFYEIWTMSVDGTSPAQLYSTSDNCTGALYSPDGSKILFISGSGGGDDEVLKMNADGTSVVNLTSNSQHDNGASWSPDGTKIVYATLPSSDYQIYNMNADGTSKTALTSNAIGHYNPTYSPDGTKIAYRATPGGTIPELYTMSSSGSSQTQLTTNGWLDAVLDWQPLTVSPTTSNANPTITVSGNTATVNIPSLYTDPYGSVDNSSITVTTAPTKGTTSINSTTGVITYTQTTTAMHRSFWSNVGSLFFPRVSAVSTDSFTYRVCSGASSSLCSTGTVGVVLAASLADTGSNTVLTSVLAIGLIVGALLIIKTRRTQPSKH